MSVMTAIDNMSDSDLRHLNSMERSETLDRRPTGAPIWSYLRPVGEYALSRTDEWLGEARLILCRVHAPKYIASQEEMLEKLVRCV